MSHMTLLLHTTSLGSCPVAASLPPSVCVDKDIIPPRSWTHMWLGLRQIQVCQPKLRPEQILGSALLKNSSKSSAIPPRMLPISSEKQPAWRIQGAGLGGSRKSNTGGNGWKNKQGSVRNRKQVRHWSPRRGGRSCRRTPGDGTEARGERTGRWIGLSKEEFSI